MPWSPYSHCSPSTASRPKRPSCHARASGPHNSPSRQGSPRERPRDLSRAHALLFPESVHRTLRLPHVRLHHRPGQNAGLGCGQSHGRARPRHRPARQRPRLRPARPTLGQSARPRTRAEGSPNRLDRRQPMIRLILILVALWLILGVALPAAWGAYVFWPDKTGTVLALAGAGGLLYAAARAIVAWRDRPRRHGPKADCAPDGEP